jgi:Fe-S-cluster containining protein
MNTRLSTMIEAVMGCYRRMDGETTAQSARSGLGCRDGCGACCASPKVEASVLEMMPMAGSLLERGRAEAVLGVLEGLETDVCVFYRPSGGACGGGCSEYPWRPTLCRMFGYAARVDKRGVRELAPCFVHRRDFPVEVELARAREVEMGEAMTFMEAGEQVRQVDPASGSPLLPINEALARAIERYAMLRDLGAGEAANEEPEDDAAGPPTEGREGSRP